MDHNFKYGTLCYDSNSMRLDIDFGNNDYYGGLHCGTPLKVFVHNHWMDTRVEYDDNWYLVGIACDDVQYGLKVGIRR